MARLATSKVHKASKIGQKSTRLVPKLPQKLRRSLSVPKRTRRSKTPPSQSAQNFLEQYTAPPIDRVIRVHYNDPSPAFENRLNNYGTESSEICHYCSFQFIGEVIRTGCGHLACVGCASVSVGPCAICGEDYLDCFDCEYAYHPAHSMINDLFDDDTIEEINEMDLRSCPNGNPISVDAPEKVIPSVDIHEYALRWEKEKETESKSVDLFFEKRSEYLTESIWGFPTIWKYQSETATTNTNLCRLEQNADVTQCDKKAAATLIEASTTSVPGSAMDVVVVLSSPRSLKIAKNPCIFPDPSSSLGDGFTRLVGFVPITRIDKKVIKAAMQSVDRNVVSPYRVGLMVAWDRNHAKGIAAVFILAKGNPLISN